MGNLISHGWAAQRSARRFIHRWSLQDSQFFSVLLGFLDVFVLPTLIHSKILNFVPMSMYPVAVDYWSTVGLPVSRASRRGAADWTWMCDDLKI